MSELNYYEILGVSEYATFGEIKKAYRREILIWHPDKNASPEAKELATLLNEAYENLSDESKRDKYDMLNKLGKYSIKNTHKQNRANTEFDIKREHVHRTHTGSVHRNMYTYKPKKKHTNFSSCEHSLQKNGYYIFTCCATLWGFFLMFSLLYTTDSVTSVLLADFSIKDGLLVSDQFILQLISWMLLSTFIFYDIQYVKSKSDKWNPNTTFWIAGCFIGGLIPLFNCILIPTYLFRRRKNMFLNIQ